MTTTLTGEKALLLAEGCKLDKEKKVIEKRLKKIKETFSNEKPGTYKNKAGDQLTISETDTFTEINPKTVFEYLKRNKMMVHFPSTVKVQITPLKKVIAESVFSKWRTKLDPIKRLSFK